MRTTINIDEHLLTEVKTQAAQTGRTIGEVIEEALRSARHRRQAAASTSVPALPVISVGGLQPGVDLDDSAALLDLMEGNDR
jgi:Ribbon-helix-helix protein, copG family